jgi:SAM-dependent methyltransferase
VSQTDRFSGRADVYEAGRPSYPLAAVTALLDGLGDPRKLAVADLGAGTGISTRLLVSQGPHVFALEPNAPMRAKAVPNPRVTWVDGTAEATTLADASVDVAAAFQAWHWFDHDVALRELKRVVRPGGRIAVLYNERDERDPFTAAFGDIFRRYATEPIEVSRTAALERFAALPGARRSTFGNVQDVDGPGLRARIASSSYVPHDGPAAAAMKAEADALFDRFATGGSVRIHLATFLVVADV